MGHKLTNYILAQDKKAKKEAKSKGKKDKKGKKGKGKDDSDDDKKKKKDKKKDKKDKKKDKKYKKKDTDEDKSYLKEAMFGKKEDDEIGVVSDEESVASEAGVDDEGAMGKFLYHCIS